MADRTQINLRQQTRRANLPEEKKNDEKEKQRDRARNRRKKKTNDNDNEPPVSVLSEDSVLEPPAACTPTLRDNADEITEPCTSSSSSHLKRRKIIDQDDIKCDEDESVQASKGYNFFQYKPQTDSSTMMTDQQLLITSSITQPPPAEVRNVKY